MEITIQRIDPSADIPPDDLVVEWIKAAAAAVDVASGELTVRFVAVDEMHALNRQWRDTDRPTNVLSFPVDAPELPVPLLGDIVVCADVVLREAREFAMTPEARFAHMLVHGFLHLNGFDHIDAPDAVQMESAESRILCALGFEDPWRQEASAP